MANKYIVIIENKKNNNPYRTADNDFLDDVAQDYFENFYTISNNLKNSYQNNIIQLAINSFIISSNLELDILLAEIQKNTESYSSYNANEFQIYVTKISHFKHSTTREKEVELQYILQKSQ